MRRAHESRGVAEPAEQFPSRLRGLPGIVIRHHAQFGISGLQRRVDHVAGNDGISARLADLHRIVVDGVARRRDQGNEFIEGVCALDDIDPIGGYDRQDGIGNPWTRRRSSFWRLVQ